ncbi:hypothetical protein JVT61DRAFT_4322 [Boletus reticuloceps]|uniref:ARID domain-containing protein n=1 Tax=Boletus reticuloceps TaxID=495285 RepID=A0A8I3A979_9AGAM|nr:hypothetical protein JVT61DRAFT_4322 [Boletus reticuloceps]
MADRMHPYPMFSQNLTPNSLQQSQIPQQPSQSQQPDPQMISALSNSEHSRMWQQMNQLQNQYRPQQPGDLAPAQMNHQASLLLRVFFSRRLSHVWEILLPRADDMQEFARGQALSHGQGQPIVQQIQQSFGLNAQRMNPAGPAFHDPQANQPQSLMPSSFSNVPMNAQQQMKAFNMNPMMHATMSNPGVPRQLKMHSQQDMARLQQGLGAHNAPNQPAAVDMFASSSMQPSQEQMHSSPHPAAQPVGPPGANQGMAPGNQQGGVRKRMITPAEFQERRNYLLSMIAQSENTLASLAQSVRNGTTVDPNIQQTLGQLRTEVANRRDVYTKFVATFGAMVTQQIANGIPSTMSHINPMAHSSSQQPQPQQPTVSNAQVQPGYVVGQSNQPVASPYKYPAGNGSSPMPAQAQGTLNQQIPMQPTPIARPNTIPPRTGGTPHQIPPGPLPSTMSPNLGNLAAQGGQKVPDQARQSVGIMPLEKQRFETTYAQFCRSQNTHSGSRVQIGENRTVDLHQLHVQVMHEGGAGSVTQRDMWAVIGGRLGFIQFPGTDTEPARCGPGIAQQLHNTYDQYLQHFENAYILTVKNRPSTGSPQQPIHQMNPNPLAGSSATPDISGNPTEMPPNPRPLLNQQFIAAALRYVLTPAQDMRTQRVPENMITFVERHRSELMKVYQQQVQLITKRNAEQEPQNMMNAQGSLPNAREQASIGLQPGVQRPSQPIGANTMSSIAGEARMANGSFVPENITAALQRQPPTQDQMQHAMLTINQLKHMFQQRSLPGMATQQIADEQRQEYREILEQLYKMTSELDGKLPMYFAVFKNEELLRKYVAIVLTVARQRQLLATPSPQYIISPVTLRSMQVQVQRLNEEFENRWRAMRISAVAAANSQQQQQQQQQQHASLTSAPARLNPVPRPSVSPMPRPTPQNNGRPPSTIPQQPPPSQSHLQPQPQSQLQPNQTQLHSQQQLVSQQGKKNFQPSISPNPSVPPPPATVASPTPPAVAAASSSTPATSAPTPQPTTSTPQTPKSPPSKAAAKNKATRVRKMSRGPATPEMAPSVAGVKRPPEEDVAALTNVAPSEAEASNAPSPKKAKTDWEGETSAALLKKQQEIENIKTDEDAAAFFDHMKELFAMTVSTDNDIHHDIVSTLGQILAGVAQEPADAAATAAALSVHGDAGPPPTALSPHMGPANDAFLEFIDFSSFTTLEDEDNDSKAPTPDLVHSSETNPSPESGSEGDSLGSTGSPDKSKIDEPGDRSDPFDSDL